ncbi:hypothetical protein BAE44_0009515 [Dichanthelium oligosanthes]|uniref:Uncharacterized protein n=1 Tax=Dichanthelium oligosanthes TaxID=888268 RepID=A0A1E5VWG6_9POAL|nr:hypothetical protein BAE44_0009515 [Dichanthelium oligosanthes]
MDVIAEALGDPPPYDSKAPWSWATINKARPPFYTSSVLCTLCTRTAAPSSCPRALGRGAGTSTRRSKGRAPSPSTQSASDGRTTGTGCCRSLTKPTSTPSWTRGSASAGCGERNGAGCLCSCDVAPPVAAELTSAPPSWKLGLDRLFRKGPRLHLCAKLLYMGHSKFCLVESLLHEVDDERLVRDSTVQVDDAQHPRRPRRRVLRITTFGLKYNKKGQLQTTLRRAGACKTYKRPHDFGESLSPLAFWL